MPIEDYISKPKEDPPLSELMECLNCEARYNVLLDEDFLNDVARYCPFCGEYIIEIGEE